MIVICIFLLLGFIVAIINPLIVLIHELGHAIPALLYSKNYNIEIFVGSYGDKKNTLKFKIGRLKFFIKYSYNFFRIRGLCVLPEQLPSLNKTLLFVFCGPLINLLTSLIVFYFVYNYADNGTFKFISSVFIGYSFFAFWANLVPKTITSENGKTYKSDGKRLAEIFRQKRIVKHATKGDFYLSEKKYELALNHYNKCIKLGFDRLLVSDTLSNVYINLKQYSNAEEILLAKIESGQANINDFYYAAYIFITKNDFDQAIIMARKGLDIGSDNQPMLNALGYCLIEKEEFDEAESALLKAMKHHDTKPYALNNLGYIKLMQGDLEGGYPLIEKSIRLNDTNGYAFRNRGIYHFLKSQLNLAKQDFEKALEVEDDVLHLNEWLEKVRKH